MSVLYVLFWIIYVMSCLFLCFVVLIQKGEGGGLGGAFGGGAVDTAFGSQADMTWKRATAVSATLFMVLAILLGIMSQYREGGSMAAEADRARQAPAIGADEGEVEKLDPEGDEIPTKADAEQAKENMPGN